MGNHTFNHLNGRKTETLEYVKNVDKAERQMAEDGWRKMEDGRWMMDDGRRMTEAGRRKLEDGKWKMDNSTINQQPSTINHPLSTNNHQQSTICNQQSLFRPPYGKVTPKQAKILQKKGYKIVMWDIISYDYDATVSEEKCLQNVLKNIKPGSVIVFHDSLKAEKNLRYALPKVLGVAGEKNWFCEAIPKLLSGGKV